MVTSIVLLVIVYTVAIVFFVLGYLNKGYYDSCNETESPTCFVVTCLNRTNTCDYYAYRCDEDGTARCSYDPNTKVAVIASDNICGGSAPPPDDNGS